MFEVVIFGKDEVSSQKIWRIFLLIKCIESRPLIHRVSRNCCCCCNPFFFYVFYQRRLKVNSIFQSLTEISPLNVPFSEWMIPRIRIYFRSSYLRLLIFFFISNFCFIFPFTRQVTRLETCRMDQMKRYTSCTGFPFPSSCYSHYHPSTFPPFCWFLIDLSPFPFTSIVRSSVTMIFLFQSCHSIFSFPFFFTLPARHSFKLAQLETTSSVTYYLLPPSFPCFVLTSFVCLPPLCLILTVPNFLESNGLGFTVW